MFNKRDRNEVRRIRHERVRKKISGTPTCPRLCVYRSNAHIYAQVIDDEGASKLVGKIVAERALAKGIKEVVFDRGGYIYTGRVAQLAEGAREGGLDF